MKIEQLIVNLDYVRKMYGNIDVNIDCPEGEIPNFELPNIGIGEIGSFNTVADENGMFKLFIDFDNKHCVKCGGIVVDKTSEYGLCSECENK